MALFSYKAVNQQGVTEEGVADASDERALLLQLQTQGLIPIRVAPAKDKTFLGIKLRSAGLRLKQKEIGMFTGELATLLESGLPLDRSLSILLQLAEDNPRLSKLVADVLDKVKSGKSLADALESQGGVFSRFYLNMIRAGEMGGNLGGVLQRLADYLERSQELKDTVSTALIYPAILLVMSLASLFVMLIFVVPQFQEMFASAGQSLPLPTRIVVGLAEFLQAYWWLLLLAILSAMQFMKLQLLDPVSRQVWDRRLLHAPLFGDIVLTMEVARFSRTFGTLLGNGVSILKSLGIVRETVGNAVLVDVMTQAEEQLKQGKTLSDVLARHAVFPKLAVQMIKMGEETGRLEEMLLRIAVIYDKQLKTTIQRMLALLEPALIISLGLMIAGIIVSILLAILSVNDLAV
ncbi:MAG: type II secretion system F family protein [Methylomonas sp.]|nr:type II secretion system F family protein [Methylomonas sp.]MBS3964761.1 type II secretion system F family protein [Methylomonas sp.]PPD22637.1 MAG: general secretion pathway protein GspF [Methylomonas sp.]PPD27949.1 MAG: general secretion pathway protein GspF [Methylomonas sp.]PPD40058.1 MAG: general secretion pathway protein GspF [Methylomonas sp.]